MTIDLSTMSERAENLLVARMERLAQAFGLSANAPGRLTEIARAEIEADERYVNSTAALDRAVSRARRRLLDRKDAERRGR
jgi:hypothetical protein